MKKRKFFAKKRFLALIVLAIIAGIIAFTLTSCRDMSEGDVVNKLASNLDEADTYLATGFMEVESEGQVYEYFVEVAFRQPHYYRVTMRNETTGNEQIILKNDEGVFVLTPALNKQFKFQSEWPLTSSQVYLYQSLLNDILNTETPVFTVGEEVYQFEIDAANHTNGNFASQTIHFCKSNLTPCLVEVHDTDGNVQMSMRFDSFEFNEDMTDDTFNAEAIMEVAQDVMGEGTVVSVANVEEAQLYPTYIPAGAALVEKTTVATETGERVIMTFGGDVTFTIIQESARLREVGSTESALGEPVLVNGTIGAVSENTLAWTRSGVEFFLVSQDLSVESLIAVATSIGETYDK